MKPLDALLNTTQRRTPPGSPRSAGQLVPAVITSALLWATLAIALVLIAQSFPDVFRYRDVFPTGDMDDVIWRYFVGPAREFWVFTDNEHLPLAVMPLYWIDLRLFHAQGLFLNVCIVALAAAIALSPLPAVLRRTHAWLLPAALAATMVAAELWLAGYVNLVWTKQVHMYLSMFAATMAIGTVARQSPHHLRRVGGSAAWAAVATFSFGYGICAFPVVLLLGYLRRWSWRRLGLVAVAMIVCLAAYVVLNLPILERNGRWALTVPVRIDRLVYYVTFLASPPINLLRQVTALPIALSIAYATTAAALLCFGAAFGVAIWRHRRETPSELLAWAMGLVLFTLLAGVQTTYARSFYGFMQAADSRYIVGQLPLWMGLLLLAVDRTLLRPRTATAALGLALALGTAGLLVSQQGFVDPLRIQSHYRWSSAMAALNEVNDREMRGRDEPVYPERVSIVMDGFRARGWSVYDWPQARWFGRTIASFGAPASGCAGALDEIIALGGSGGGFKVSGWAADSPAKVRSSWILLADNSEIVRGLGYGGGIRADVARALHNSDLLFAGWTGYVPAAEADKTITAWLLVKGRHPCRLSKTRSVRP